MRHTPQAVHHRSIPAAPRAAPGPFHTYAVRSEEPLHALDARAPYGRVHAVQTTFLPAQALARLAADGQGRVAGAAFSDIEHALTTPQELAAVAPEVPGLMDRIAGALQLTGVLGADAASYRRGVASRVDYLVACGAGFHNDVARHWPRCLFWVLALQVDDVEFVMPHAGLRLPLAPGDLLVFDQTMAHGLCRPADEGRAVAASFDPALHRPQVFLTGELLLGDAQWAALGAPWLPVEQHRQRGALDLMVATFDDCSGAIQRLQALRGCMDPGTSHVDGAAA